MISGSECTAESYRILSYCCASARWASFGYYCFAITKAESFVCFSRNITNTRWHVQTTPHHTKKEKPCGGSRTFLIFCFLVWCGVAFLTYHCRVWVWFLHGKADILFCFGNTQFDWLNPVARILYTACSAGESTVLQSHEAWSTLILEKFWVPGFRQILGGCGLQQFRIDSLWKILRSVIPLVQYVTVGCRL